VKLYSISLGLSPNGETGAHFLDETGALAEACFRTRRGGSATVLVRDGFTGPATPVLVVDERGVHAVAQSTGAEA